MEGTGWRLTDDELRQWLDRLLREDLCVIGSVDDDGLRHFRQLSSADELSLAPGTTRLSPKTFLLPRTETLYSYTLGAEGPELHDPPLANREQVLVGLRCCDAAGLVRLDEVFLEGRVEDPLYARRRALTTVVAFACAEALPQCFCTAVGGSPMGTEGIDLLFVPLQRDCWLVRTLTDKGRTLAASQWSAASAEDAVFIHEQERRVAGQIERASVPENLAELLEGGFDDAVWKEVAQTCLSCSICAYLCPSCSCFDVHHQGHAWGGREIRCWDACTFPLFTLHASGHNPRSGVDARYRQRMLHKFAYLAPGQEGKIRCVGCGRCIASCPAGIDIHDAVQRVAIRSAAGEAHD